MAKRKRQRVPKGAKGLTLKRGQCRVLRTRVRICVSRSGVIKVTPAPSRRRKGKRKAAPRRRGKRRTTRRKTTRRRKRRVTRKKVCRTGAFKLRTKKGVRCACGVGGKKRGSLRLQQISMKHPKCRAGIPGPMSWRAFKEKRSGVATRPVFSV